MSPNNKDPLPNTLPLTTPPQFSSGHLRRSMSGRHLVMIALGGVIGSGLFLSSGYTIHQGGPLGAVIAYLCGALVVYMVLACLGELALAYPVSGAFHIYASRAINPATGFTTAWLYWLSWVVTLGSEFTASGILMQRWFPDLPVWLFCLVFAAAIFTLNAISARTFGEAEFWFAGIKVAAIVVLIALGAAAVLGFTPLSDSNPGAVLFSNFTTSDGLLPNGLGGVLMTTLTVFFAFCGAELIGVAAGETKDPVKQIPRALRSTTVRLILFYVGAITVIAALVPYERAGVTSSPFVDVFEYIGIPYAPDIMNFVVITALLSAGNSGLFSCGRMLFSLAEEGHASTSFLRLTRRGIPIVALAISMLVALVCLLSSVVAASTVYLALVSIAAFASVAVWISIVASQFFYRRKFLAAGGAIKDLPYKTPLYPALPILAFTLLVIAMVASAFDPNQFAAVAFGVPFTIGCYVYFWIRYGRLGARRRVKVAEEVIDPRSLRLEPPDERSHETAITAADRQGDAVPAPGEIAK